MTINAVMSGLDLSHWNTVNNFVDVRNRYNFVILKAGGSDSGFYKDSCFEKYYYQAKLATLAVGAYYFVGKNFYGKDAGIKEAQRFLQLLTGKEFDMPIYIDVETTLPAKKLEVTEATYSFCEYLEKQGSFIGIYSSDLAGFRDRLNMKSLSRFAFWVARYGSKPKYVKSYGMWQCSSSATCPGIRGKVDLDLCYVDYPRIIKQKGLNRF